MIYWPRKLNNNAIKIKIVGRIKASSMLFSKNVLQWLVKKKQFQVIFNYLNRD